MDKDGTDKQPNKPRRPNAWSSDPVERSMAARSTPSPKPPAENPWTSKPKADAPKEPATNAKPPAPASSASTTEASKSPPKPTGWPFVDRAREVWHHSSEGTRFARTLGTGLGAVMLAHGIYRGISTNSLEAEEKNPEQEGVARKQMIAETLIGGGLAALSLFAGKTR